MPEAVDQVAAVDPGHARRGRVGDGHIEVHQRDVVVPRVGDQPGGRRVRVERDADLAEAARKRDHVVGQPDRLLLGQQRRGIGPVSAAAHLDAREEVRVPHARAVRERAADDRRARRRRPLPAPLRPDRLCASGARHDAQRRDVGAARGGTAAAEVVSGLDVAAPARHVRSEVVGQRVLAGARVGRTRQEEQDGCHEWQEADALHRAMVALPTVTCLCQSGGAVDAGSACASHAGSLVSPVTWISRRGDS